MALSKDPRTGIYLTEFPKLDDPSRRDRRSTFVTCPKEAKRINKERLSEYRAAKAAKARGERPQGPRGEKHMTFDVACENFYQEKAKFEVGKEVENETTLDRLAAGIGRTLKLHEVIPKLSVYIAKRRQETTRRNKKIAPATVNHDIKMVRRVLRYARDVWDIHVGKWPRWKKDFMLKEPPARIRFLTQEQEKKLFDNLRWDLHPMVRFAFMQGIRVGNIWRLTWEEVDFENGFLNLIQKGGERLHLKLRPAARLHLLAQKGNHPTRVFTYVAQHSKLERRKGQHQPFTKTGWTKPWRAALKAAGITDYVFHDNRHTFATRLAPRARHLGVVQAALGHKSITTTMRYSHLIPSDLEDGLNSMLETFYPTQPPHEASKKRQPVGKKR